MEIEVTGTKGEKGDKGDKGIQGIAGKLQNWHVLLGIGMICFSILSRRMRTWCGISASRARSRNRSSNRLGSSNRQARKGGG